MTTKYVYFFGPQGTEGDASMKNALGGKGANLAEMAKLGLPVPAGFTINTEFCTVYFAEGRQFPQSLRDEVAAALRKTEEAMGMKFGDPASPLLVSCRSGARQSMPGMMETVLNVGLCSATIPGLVKKSGNERFVYDAYRRLIMMYSDVVMEKAEDIEPAEGKGIRVQLEHLMARLKKSKKYKSDTDLTTADLKRLCGSFKKKVQEVLGREFPDSPEEQLWGAIGAVFKSWEGRRAVSYRRIEGIPGEWGTACNVQSMVFGNLGDTSATGVAFSRNPATGENKFYGEWLVNAQGEDVVAGIRTPNPLNEETKNPQNQHLPRCKPNGPSLYRQLDDIRSKLEQHYHDMQDIEFTIQDGKLYMLQCRNGKRTGTAALNMAMDMLAEGLIDEQTAVTRVQPAQLDELLHPIINPASEKNAEAFLSGLPAGPGGACGKIVFTSVDAVEVGQAGRDRDSRARGDQPGGRGRDACGRGHSDRPRRHDQPRRAGGPRLGQVLHRRRRRSEDRHGRQTPYGRRRETQGRRPDHAERHQGQGSTPGALEMMDATENPRFQGFMKLVDKFRKLGVRTNADTPQDAKVARQFGAEGIGLFRTEHMFYGEGSDQPLFLLRKMIAQQDRSRSARRPWPSCSRS